MIDKLDALQLSTSVNHAKCKRIQVSNGRRDAPKMEMSEQEIQRGTLSS